MNDDSEVPVKRPSEYHPHSYDNDDGYTVVVSNKPSDQVGDKTYKEVLDDASKLQKLIKPKK